MKVKEKKYLINEEISVSKVRIINNEIMSIDEALSLAKLDNMDLVLFNIDDNNIGNCKIMNYEKYLYEQTKKNKKKKVDLKEIKIGVNISENDLNYRINHINNFITKGNKVKITMEFKGREITHIEKAKAVLLSLLVKLEDISVPEFLPKLEGKKMFTILRPKK